MASFKKLHHAGKLQKPVCVNIDHVVSIEDRTDLEGSEVTLSSGKVLIVSESAEEILSED